MAWQVWHQTKLQELPALQPLAAVLHGYFGHPATGRNAALHCRGGLIARAQRYSNGHCSGQAWHDQRELSAVQQTLLVVD